MRHAKFYRTIGWIFRISWLARLTVIVCGFIAFLIVHLTEDKLDRLLRRAMRLPMSDHVFYWVGTIRDHAPSVKALVFIFVLIILFWPILRHFIQGIKFSTLAGTGKAILATVAIFIAVALFTFRPGTDSMGTNYAIIARDPFSQNTSSHSTQLLMPALACFFYLRDFKSYYLFSVLLTLVFIALLYSWMKYHASLKIWHFVSLFTCSFVIFQYQYGGYSDILVYIFFVIVMGDNTNQDAKLSALVLALLAHVSSVFTGIILAFRYLDRKNLFGYVLLVAMYGLIWLWVSDWNIQAIMATHSVEGRSGVDWLIQSPLQEIMGILVSYKVLWIAFVTAIWVSLKKRLFQDGIFIVACIGSGLLMTILGVDTSRLMGFAFPGILIAISVIQNQLEVKKSHQLLGTLFLLNLVAPSFYIGLNGWIEFYPGIYNFLYGWMDKIRL